ncbi:MAG: energy transducer TonB [Methylococcaceae bacterium]|nr:energy transducer TonB [Methylococcaceae bacterium]
MANSILFKPTSVVSRNDRLLIAVFAAIIFHALLLLINFSSSKPKRINRDIEITLEAKTTPKPPKHARYLAPEHQLGGGQKKIKPTSPKQKIPSVGQTEKPVLTQNPAPVKHQAAPKIITQKVSKKALPTTQIVEQEIPKTPSQPQPQLSLDTLKTQIAELGAQIAKHEKQGEEISRIKLTSAVSANKSIAAQYKNDFIQKVERIGSLNFPEAAMKNVALAHVTMNVGIKADGSIYSINIQKSSGYPALDKAAKKIVSMSAPFPKLPKALLNELDILVISREYTFSDKSRMSAN